MKTRNLLCESAPNLNRYHFGEVNQGVIDEFKVVAEQWIAAVGRGDNQALKSFCAEPHESEALQKYGCHLLTGNFHFIGAYRAWMGLQLLYLRRDKTITSFDVIAFTITSEHGVITVQRVDRL